MSTTKLLFGYDTLHKKGDYVAPQSHSCFELVYFVKTKNEFTIGNNPPVILQDGSFYLLNPNTLHSETHIEDGRVIFVGFDCKPPISDLIVEGIYNIPQHGEIYTLMSSIIKEISNKNIFYEEIISNLIDRIVLLISRYNSKSQSRSSNIEYAYNYISEYYNQQIDLLHIAKTAGYSIDRFRHIFVETYGVSPKQFQMTMRLEKSIELLSNTDITCNEISSLCGFSTNAQFSKLFTEKYGIPPLQFRKNRK